MLGRQCPSGSGGESLESWVLIPCSSVSSESAEYGAKRMIWYHHVVHTHTYTHIITFYFKDAPGHFALWRFQVEAKKAEFFKYVIWVNYRLNFSLLKKTFCSWFQPWKDWCVCSFLSFWSVWLTIHRPCMRFPAFIKLYCMCQHNKGIRQYKITT